MGSWFSSRNHNTERGRLSSANLALRLLYGFSRQNVPLLSIPKDIILLLIEFSAAHTIRFYKHLDWEGTYLRESAVIENLIEFRNHDCKRSAYGQLAVSTGHHEWDLKLENITNSRGLMIGIATTHLAFGHFHDRPRTPGFKAYAFGQSLDGTVSAIGNEGHQLISQQIGSRFHWESGDVITVILNLDDCTLEFRRKHKSLAVIEEIHTKDYDENKLFYRLAIDNFYCGNRIRLISYR